MARNEFKPPSDFVAGDGGGKTNWWKWLGIGCGIIVLIIGGLLALGTWRTVSCCSEAFDQAKLTMEAGKFSTAFARELATGEVDAARAKMTDELKATIPADDLRSKLDEYRGLLASSPGRLSGVSVNKKGVEEPTVWKTSVEFAPPSGQQKLVVMLEVVSQGEGETQAFLVDDLKFETRSRDIGSEPAAVEVLDFHRQLRSGNYESAYRHMSSEFTQKNNIDAFRSFVREQKEVFRTGQVDIASVEYGQEKTARVVAVATNEGQRARIAYKLVRPVENVPKWLISSITPSYDVAAPTPDTQPKGDAGTDATGADSGSAQDGGDTAKSQN